MRGAAADSDGKAGAVSSGLLSRRSLRGATALRGGGAWRPGPYLVFGFLYWLAMSLAYWAAPLCCEAGLHAAVIERLRVDLWHPRHPLADLPGAGSPYYSPYAVAQGVFARLTGLGGWEVVRLAGPLNLLVLLTGLGRLVRVLTPRPWAPVLALPVLLMTGDLGSPAAFAVGLTLWAWALTGARARNDGALRYVGPSGLPGIAGYVGPGVLYGAVLLVDPVTAVGAAAGAVAFVAGWQRGWGRAVGVRWAVTAGVAVLVAAGWPYFDLVAPDRVPVPWRFWPALVGLPALWPRGRRDPLTLMFVLGCPVAACGYGGIAGLVALVCAAAVELAAPRPWGARRRGTPGSWPRWPASGFSRRRGRRRRRRTSGRRGMSDAVRWSSRPTATPPWRSRGSGRISFRPALWRRATSRTYGPISPRRRPAPTVPPWSGATECAGCC